MDAERAAAAVVGYQYNNIYNLSSGSRYENIIFLVSVGEGQKGGALRSFVCRIVLTISSHCSRCEIIL